MSATVNQPIKVLIADDEPLLRSSFRTELLRAWPDLGDVVEVGDGHHALRELQSSAIDIAFLDIRMPGMTGLEVAQHLMSGQSDSAMNSSTGGSPLLVFVTAYDEFAVQAFESAAIDYILKPVTPERLSLTLTRLTSRLAERAKRSATLDVDSLQAIARQLTQLTDNQPERLTDDTRSYLQFIRAGVGDAVRMIPVAEVVLFEACDKYVTVHTAEGEWLIRESLRELAAQLDPLRFQRIHRSRIVNLSATRSANRDAHGKLVLTLNGSDQTPVVSRQYTHLFKAM